MRYVNYLCGISLAPMLVLVSTTMAQIKLTHEEIVSYNEFIQSSTQSQYNDTEPDPIELSNQVWSSFLKFDSTQRKYFQQVADALQASSTENYSENQRRVIIEMARRGVVMNRAFQSPTDAFFAAAGHATRTQ